MYKALQLWLCTKNSAMKNFCKIPKRKSFVRYTFTYIERLVFKFDLFEASMLILAYNTIFCKSETYKHDEDPISPKFVNVLA